MNVLFKMKKLYDIVITMQSQRTLGKQALPCALFFISLTTVCLSNSSKMYFHFYTPRLRKHVSLKGFSYTISEMAIQKKAIFGLHDMPNMFSQLANKRASRPTAPCHLFLPLQLLQWSFPYSLYFTRLL